MLNTKTKPIVIPEFAPFKNFDAGVTKLDQTQQIRSEARLEQIFASARHEAPTVAIPNRRTATAKTWALRLGAIPVAAAAIIAGSLALPQNTGIVAPAFANWTAIPTPISDIPANSLASYNDACRAYIESELLNDPRMAGWILPIPVPAEPTLADTRGDLTWLIYRVSNDTSFHCVIGTAPVPATADQIMFVSLPNARTNSGGFTGLSVSGPSFTNMSSMFFFGDSTHAPDSVALTSIVEALPWPSDVADLHPREVLDFWDSGQLIRVRLFEGLIGENVTNVVLHTRGGTDITATVGNGMFAAWLPFGDTQAAISERAIESFTITLNDGTTITQMTNADQIR